MIWVALMLLLKEEKAAAIYAAICLALIAAVCVLPFIVMWFP